MILIRHGQSEFNAVFSLTRVDPQIPDPRLTAEGRRQAAQVAESLADVGIRRLISSPYIRALETATIIAERLNVEVTIEPLVRERAAFHCDIGTARDELSRLFPAYRFDHLEHPWWHDHIATGVGETEEALIARSARFRTAMAAVSDWSQVGVVTHWGFIRALTGRPVANCELVRLDLTLEAP